MADFLADIKSSTKDYLKKWEDFRTKYKLEEFKPATIGYKAENIANFNEIISALAEQGLIEQCHIGAVDNRYIASIVLHKPIVDDIYIIKLMQKRPKSADPTGLDHVDFYVTDLADIERLFQNKEIASWGA
ncbi:MAG: hypothetical protein WDN66_00330 [Candidatus Saccharibacteria bacterium]